MRAFSVLSFRRQQRAYALPLVLVMVALLATALGLYLRTADGVQRTSARLFRRQQAQVALTGTTRATALATGQFLFGQAAEPTPMPVGRVEAAAAMAAYLDSLRIAANEHLATLKSGLTPTGMILEKLEIDAIAQRKNGVVEDGPFAGMNAVIQRFDVAITGRHREMRDGSLVNMGATAERIFIPMFQFFAFIDGYAFIFNGPGARFSGRVHSNGNMCIGAGSLTHFETITSAGSIYRLGGTGCRKEKSGGFSSPGVPSPTIHVSTNGFPDPFDAAGFTLLNKDADSRTWLTDVNAWRGTSPAVLHVADRLHGIPTLKPPITGSPLTQKGRNAIHGLRLNNDNSRFLVDPVLTTDVSEVAQQKMAFKADIRIIDGVWYLRDVARPFELGTPIWSDHPGRTATSDIEDRWSGVQARVGQDDLFSAARPQRFSYYRTAAPLKALLAPPSIRGVVSYGTLHRKLVGADPVWVPGYYETTANSTAGCLAASASNQPTSTCFATQEATTAAQIVQATRSGFRSAWDESGVTSGASDCSLDAASSVTDRQASLPTGTNNGQRTAMVNMLPLNFDIEAFQDALADTNANELGSKFTSRKFNGVIFISATWPGFRTGFGTAATSGKATHWPFQGLQSDPFSGEDPSTLEKGQPRDATVGTTTVLQGLTNAEVYEGRAFTTTGAGLEISASSRQANHPYQQALPYSLCTDDYTTVLADSALAQYTGAFAAGTGRKFYAPRCSRYHDTASASRINARINAVRLINGSNFRKAVLPAGLSIVSNLPLFILGSINTKSDGLTTVLGHRPSESMAPAWSPLLVGGDTIGLLSNAWTDDESPWNVPVNSYFEMRVPTSTQYNGAFLYGWAEAALNTVTNVGCREELTYSMRLHERWSAAAGIGRVIRGSIFVGWNSVYGSAFSNVHEADNSGAWHDADGSTKIYGYDYHFDEIVNQPPGAPQFELTNIKRIVDE